MENAYRARTLTMPDGGWVRTVVRDTHEELELTDEEYFERHPMLREIMERWAAEGREKDA
ncbi:hypothetical protein ACIRD2_02950 [Streptomyces sp. NPDC093595]|uniref:hypothetical protein n=1 Tax=Streptomyces sp. NPDC093595 TaxID=3366045 RepID=UPI0037FDF481